MKRAWIEGVVFFVVSILSIVEGVRLIFERDPMKVPEPFGPGAYLTVIGAFLLLVGFVHVFVHGRPGTKTGHPRAPIDLAMKRKVIMLGAALAVYIGLLTVIGYTVATPLFFLTAFRIAGVRSWRSNVLITVFLSAGFYLIFVRYCNMTFPRVNFFGM